MSADLNFLHLDMDAFFAAVEERDNPELKGHPVIVGGKSNRGIVTTCNYIAREYGIHSAMPIFMAKEKCPHGIYVPGRMDRYQEVSKEVFKVLRTITPIIEPLSIDEAYMDIRSFSNTPEEISDKIIETLEKSQQNQKQVQQMLEQLNTQQQLLEQIKTKLGL